VVWPQNHSDGFYRFGLKTSGDGFSSVWTSKPMATVSSGFASKPAVMISAGLSLKAVVTVSSD
jgi:hypothetical protein